jgi:FADH2 O2-dependent halogenase
MPAGPYPDDWAAVHHIVDEGWMYSLRFDDGVTSAGFLLTARGLASLNASSTDATALWAELLRRYPTIAAAFGDAKALVPVGFRPSIQHRLTRATGERWLLMPHAYAFVDPLFSTGIAWSLRAVERLGLAFEEAAHGARVPGSEFLSRYDAALAAEADQIDLVVAGAYEAMAHFDLFAAQAMLYFATVSFAEVSQRLAPTDSVAWSGFLGVGDRPIEHVARQSLEKLEQITRRRAEIGSPLEREAFADWMARAIAPRNIAGLADSRRQNLYPVDFDALIEGHDRLGLSRDQVLAALPALRGMSPNGPPFKGRQSGLAAMTPPSPFYAADAVNNPR